MGIDKLRHRSKVIYSPALNKTIILLYHAVSNLILTSEKNKGITFQLGTSGSMGVNPGGDAGDMPPPIWGLSPPPKIFKKITLSIVKNICMYTYNNLSRKKKNAKSAFRNSWVPPPLPYSGLAHCLLSQFISPTPHTSQVCGCGSVNVELQ